MESGEGGDLEKREPVEQMSAREQKIQKWIKPWIFKHSK